MDVDAYLGHLQREGETLADAAAAAGPDAAVPTCPEWQVRDLVRHVSGVHRWATTIVRDALPVLPDRPLEVLAGGWPDDADLVDWFRAGHRTLVQTLRDADPDLECFTFLPAPSPRVFWARRQTHETAVHRVDAQSATGAITPLDADQAGDGIDEHLGGFARRRTAWPWTEPRRLALRAVDSGRAWHLEIGPERAAVVEPDDQAGDCTIEASASDLMLLVWNRDPLDAVAVTGDPEVVAAWQELVHVRWSE